jgi:hypothetical protein
VSESTRITQLILSSVYSVPLPLPLSQKNTEKLPAEVVVPARPQYRYPLALRETGSTLFQPQLHPPIGRYTSVYILKPADESDAIFFWTTEP